MQTNKSPRSLRGVAGQADCPVAFVLPLIKYYDHWLSSTCEEHLYIHELLVRLPAQVWAGRQASKLVLSCSVGLRPVWSM